MKTIKTLLGVYGLLVCASLNSATARSVPTDDPTTTASNDSLTPEEWKHLEDSIYHVFFPEPVIVTMDLDDLPQDEPAEPDGATIYVSSGLPTSSDPNKQYCVGEIGLNSSVSASGAKTYGVPLILPSGYSQTSTPALELSYSSQMGNGVLGMGWSLGGVSSIRRINKTIYYDSQTSGISMSINDAFALDGMRLVQISLAGDSIIYQTAQGNTMVKARFTGSTIKYFEVFYPDGSSAVFGFQSNSENRISYPITKRTDYNDNSITYSYTLDNNIYHISSISYNGSSVVFSYTPERPDTIHGFQNGKEIVETKLLSAIESKVGSSMLAQYGFTYETKNNSSVLKQITLRGSDGRLLNPLTFHYGNNDSSPSFSSATTSLPKSWKSDFSGAVSVVRGKFDYGSGNDGIIIYPNRDPYWNPAKSGSTATSGFENKYKLTDTLFVYVEIDKPSAELTANILPENGFVDLFCADLTGTQEEYIVKVNNYVDGSSEKLVFHVYVATAIGLTKKYTRSFTLSTAYSKSVQPKYYFPGDFNGDGKMEVLAVSAHQPFGDGKHPSRCYIFDLIGGRIVYEHSLLQFHQEFFNMNVENGWDVSNNSDRLFLMDYNADGKTELCHIGQNGTDIYTFYESSGLWSSSKTGSHPSFKRSSYADKYLMPMDINSDGITDLVMSPVYNNVLAYWWTICQGKGDGTFGLGSFYGPRVGELGNVDYLLQDVNGDGVMDVISQGAYGFSAHITNPYQEKIDNAASVSYTDQTTKVVTADISSRNSFATVLTLSGNTLKRHTYSRNDRLESLLTAAVSSHGTVEQNTYVMANASPETYVKENRSVYPYVDLYEAFPLLKISEHYLYDKKLSSMSYTYSGGVSHRQGLGFIGFSTSISTDIRGNFTSRVYDVSQYGNLKSEESPVMKKTYDYTINKFNGGRMRIDLKSMTDTDKLSGYYSSSSFTYDTYGNVTSSSIKYSDNISVTASMSYANNNKVAKGFYLGVLIDKTTTRTSGQDSYIERMQVAERNGILPKTIKQYVDNSLMETKEFSYNSGGLPTVEKNKLCSSSVWLQSSFSYDSYGRCLSKTDPLGLTETFTYSAVGRLATSKDVYAGVTSYSYDGLGRETYRSLPDSTYVNTFYEWTSVSGTTYQIRNTTNAGAEERTLYDADGKEITVSTLRYDGNYYNVSNKYDPYGRLSQTSLPYRASTQQQYVQYSYDSYDRIVSESHPSGKTSSWSYSGSSVTSTVNGISTIRKSNSQGEVIEVSDLSGKVVYTLNADGQPSKITAPGNVVASYEYDAFRRIKKRIDPSFGTTTYTYDAAGNLSTETDADNRTTSFTYDSYGRILKRITPDNTVTYTYNTKGDLSSVGTDGGITSTYTYDNIGRLSKNRQEVSSSVYLEEQYSYSGGNVKSKTVNVAGKLSLKENYTYQRGEMIKITDGNDYRIYSLDGLSTMGMPIRTMSGPMVSEYSYDSYGILTSMNYTASTGPLFRIGYSFDSHTGNLLSRSDKIRNKTESFTYDGLNRLTSTPAGDIEFDSKGNILSNEAVGTFSYSSSSKPYALTGASFVPAVGTPSAQTVSYTAFHRPKSISESGTTVSFIYDGNDRLVKATYNNGAEKYFLGGCMEYTPASAGSSESIVVYMGGDSHTARCVYEHKNGTTVKYNIARDYLGNVIGISGSDGSCKGEYSYDPWGRLRDPATHAVYAPGDEPAVMFNRGFGSHLWLPEFGIIHMEARLYDPMLGRFLSPDPYVQAPDSPQNFNRYSYCLNNPLIYSDPTGEWFGIDDLIIGAIGGIVNLGVNIFQGNIKGNFWQVIGKSFAAFGSGAVAGIAAEYGPAGWALGGALVGSTNTWLGGGNAGDVLVGSVYGAASGVIGGYAGKIGETIGNITINSINIKGPAIIGAIKGSVGGLIGGGVSNFTSSYIFTGDIDKAWDSAKDGVIYGAAIGSISGMGAGLKYAKNHKLNPWTGEKRHLHHPMPRYLLENRNMEQDLVLVSSDRHLNKLHKEMNNYMKQFEGYYKETELIPMAYSNKNPGYKIREAFTPNIRFNNVKSFYDSNKIRYFDVRYHFYKTYNLRWRPW